MRIHIASDYAVLAVPEKDISLYYGYESTPKDDLSLWSFECNEGKHEDGLPRNIIVYSCKDLGMKDRFDVTGGLLRGIAKLIEDGILVKGEV